MNLSMPIYWYLFALLMLPSWLSTFEVPYSIIKQYKELMPLMYMWYHVLIIVMTYEVSAQF